ncbi:AVR4 protein, partial [Spelaeornis formosus]|nr:AVR4 protein [Elachura formosa]
MVQAAPFILVLLLALGAHAFPSQQCNLAGFWKNDLGSNMTIFDLNKKGNFFGNYSTAVSTNSSNIKVSPLLGSQHKGPNQKGQPTFGFTVHWSFSDSITVFTGQCFVDDNGKEVLKTMWLLRSHMDECSDDWKATR